MGNTLTYTDSITRIGYTIVDGVKIVQYNLVIPMSNPEAMRCTAQRLKPELYKANKEICRADQAAFEDAAYALQDELLAKITDVKEEE